MRHVACAAILCLFAAVEAAEAACVSEGVVLFPRPGAVVPINAEFILEGRGSEAERVAALVGKKLTLQGSDGDSVPVLVRKGWKSDMHRAAVRLVPQRKLKAEARYVLQLASALPNARNLDQRGSTELAWRTGKEPDNERPRWEHRPAPAEGRYYTEDGKLHRELRFNLSLKEISPAYVVITLRRARGPAVSQTYFAPIDSALVTIGHDGCSGSFSFDDGRAYVARIDAFDAAGNRAPTTPPLEFHAPKLVRP